MVKTWNKAIKVGTNWRWFFVVQIKYVVILTVVLTGSFLDFLISSSQGLREGIQEVHRTRGREILEPGKAKIRTLIFLQSDPKLMVAFSTRSAGSYI